MKLACIVYNTYCIVLCIILYMLVLFRLYRYRYIPVPVPVLPVGTVRAIFCFVHYGEGGLPPPGEGISTVLTLISTRVRARRDTCFQNTRRKMQAPSPPTTVTFPLVTPVGIGVVREVTRLDVAQRYEQTLVIFSQHRELLKTQHAHQATTRARRGWRAGLSAYVT